MTIPLRLTPTAAQIFGSACPEDGSSFARLLSGFDQPTMLHLIARLGRMVARGGSSEWLETQKACLDLLSASRGVRAKLDEFARAHKSVPGVVFRGQLLELARWALHCCPRTSSEMNVPGDDLIRALLVAGDVWGRRRWSGLSTTYKAPVERTASLDAIWRRQMQDNVLLPVRQQDRGRQWLLFVLGMRDAWPEFEAEIGTATGVPLLQYVAILDALTRVYIPDGEPPAGDMFDPETFSQQLKMREPFERVMTELVQSTSDLAEAWWRDDVDVAGAFLNPPPMNMKPLRARPVVMVRPARAVVLDPISFADLPHVGLVFRVRGARRQVALTQFGRAFESYVLRALRAAFPDGVGLQPRVHGQTELRDGTQTETAIDAVIDDGDRAMLVEAKGLWVADDRLEAGAEQSLITTIDERLVFDPDGDAPKGIGQLAAFVRGLAKRPITAWPNAVSNLAREFVPILVVSDTSLSPAVRRHLVDQFAKAVAPAEWSSGTFRVDGVTSIRVAPPVVLAIDELELAGGIAAERRLSDVLSEFRDWVMTDEGGLPDFLKLRGLSSALRCPDFLFAASKEAEESTERELGIRFARPEPSE